VIPAHHFCGAQQFLESGELFASRGGFVTRAAAVQWADMERIAIEKGSA